MINLPWCVKFLGARETGTTKAIRFLNPNIDRFSIGKVPKSECIAFNGHCELDKVIYRGNQEKGKEKYVKLRVIAKAWHSSSLMDNTIMLQMNHKLHIVIYSTKWLILLWKVSYMLTEIILSWFPHKLRLNSGELSMITRSSDGVSKFYYLRQRTVQCCPSVTDMKLILGYQTLDWHVYQVNAIVASSNIESETDRWSTERESIRVFVRVCVCQRKKTYFRLNLCWFHINIDICHDLDNL